MRVECAPGLSLKSKSTLPETGSVRRSTRWLRVKIFSLSPSSLDLRPVRHWSVTQITRHVHTGQLLGGVPGSAHLFLSHKDTATGHHYVGVSQHDQEAQAFIAGQLRQAREVSIIFAQYVTSYKPLVLVGHGVRLRVQQGTLLVQNGFTHYPQKQEEKRLFPADRRLPSRIIALESDGSISLDVTAGCIDTDLPQDDATSADQTSPSSRARLCIMRCGPGSLNPAVGRERARQAPLASLPRKRESRGRRRRSEQGGSHPHAIGTYPEPGLRQSLGMGLCGDNGPPPRWSSESTTPAFRFRAVLTSDTNVAVELARHLQDGEGPGGCRDAFPTSRV